MTLNEIENFFRINLDEFRLARIQISEWIGINLVQNEFESETFTKALFILEIKISTIKPLLPLFAHIKQHLRLKPNKSFA